MSIRCEVEVLVQCPAGPKPHYEDIKDCIKCDDHRSIVFTRRSRYPDVFECKYIKEPKTVGSQQRRTEE